MSTTAAETAPAAAPAPGELPREGLLQRVILPRLGDPMSVRALYVDERTGLRLTTTTALPTDLPVKPVHLTGSTVGGGRRLHATSRTSAVIDADSEVSFGAYFNAFAASYWRRWTTLDKVRLRLDLTGGGRVDVYRTKADGSQIFERSELLNGPGRHQVDMELDLRPFEDGGWYWFDLTTDADELTLHGGGWYAEILAPFLREHGRYIAAVVDPMALPEERRDYSRRAKESLEKKLAASPELYGRAEVVAYDPEAPRFGEPGSADVVLTFRNVHNWRMAGQAEGMFRGFYEVLRPGGVLGVVEHRANGDVPEDDRSGYVGEAQVIALAEAAGFVLDGKSEVNANPQDTKDHPDGVWMLPPTNRHDPADAQRYRAIGESDRMTLRFVKPASE